MSPDHIFLHILKLVLILKKVLVISLFLKKNITTIIPAYTYTGKGKFFLSKENSNLSYMTKWILKKKIL